MLNKDSAAFFSLVDRTFGATDQPSADYPDMVGVIRIGDQEVDLVSWLEIDAINGTKFANFRSLENGDGVSYTGKLFRDETVFGKPQYRGFLQQACKASEDETIEYVPSNWQLEISAEHRTWSCGQNAIEGWCFPLKMAPKFSCNAITKESKLPF